MGNNTTTNTTPESSSASNPADNIIKDDSATTNSTTTSTTSKPNPAASPPDRALTDSTQGDADNVAVERFKYMLVGEFDWLADNYPYVEEINHYDQGGFHPVLLGDVLGDGSRFRVVHKLGQGRFATIWLCHDSVSKKWRAVKIMQARASAADCPNMRALKLFDGMDPDVLATNGVQLPLEHFWIEGPNGRHLCLVLPLLGCEPTSIARRYGHVPELMKDICFRLVMALRFIHSQGLCHGNFRPQHTLFRLVDGVDEWEEEAIMKLLGEPTITPVQHIDGLEVDIEPSVPRYLVTPTKIKSHEGVCSSKIAVIDFTCSYPVTQTPEHRTGLPTRYESPELLFRQGDGLGFHGDIWSLGVALCEARLDFEPFATFPEECSTSVLDAVRNMERIMGPLPEPYRSIWKEWGKEFVNSVDEKGEPLNDDSWKDESVMATLGTRWEELDRGRRMRERGHPHMLNFVMRSEREMFITESIATHITNQATADPSRMPRIGLDDYRCSYKDRVKYQLPADELDQMFDLLMKIFQWHPEDRVTIDQIANHEWFGDRNKQNQAATGTTRNDTNAGADTTAATTDTDTDPDTDSASQPAS